MIDVKGIQPAGRNILVKVLEEKTEGLLVVPDRRTKRIISATIVATGPDVPVYRVGDRVLLSWYTGMELDTIVLRDEGGTVDSDAYKVITDQEILATY